MVIMNTLPVKIVIIIDYSSFIISNSQCNILDNKAYRFVLL